MPLAFPLALLRLKKPMEVALSATIAAQRVIETEQL